MQAPRRRGRYFGLQLSSLRAGRRRQGNAAGRPLRLEHLEARRVLAAIAVDDPSFVTDQDTALVAGADVSTEVISPSEYWDYLDKIKNHRHATGPMGYPADGDGDAWNSPQFDIATSTIGPWGNGPGILGAGGINAGTTQTVLEGIDDGIGGDNSVTTYLFRHQFDLTNSDDIHRLEFSMLVDDGAVIYVNGIELIRVNMPAGTITTQTEAGLGNEDNYLDFAIDLSLAPEIELNDGPNTIAVEVHNDQLGSSDIGWDLSLTTVASSGGGVLDNDVDALLAVLDSNVSHGTLQLNADGTFVYAPGPNFFGTDSFTYRAAELAAHLPLITAGSGSQGQTWNYLHPLNGVDPASSDSDFHSTWFHNDGSYDGPAFSGSGKGTLGYGTISEGPIATHIGQPSSGDRYAAYFTSTFELSVDPLQVNGLTADILADDGAYIYINGVRVGQLNMAPNGQDTYTTLASGEGNENNFTQISLDPDSLVAGTNFIAISLHNNQTGSSDQGLDFGLTASVLPELSDPATVTITVNDAGIPPIAVNDAYTAQVNQSLDTAAAGLTSVLDNESPITEIGDASFEIQIDDSATEGTVVMDPVTGHFVYTPPTNFKGTTTFTYTLTDDEGISTPATVSISVEGDTITDNQQAVAPLGSLVYTSETSPFFDTPGQTHNFPLQFAENQRVTLVATPDSAGLDLSIVVRDASSDIVASVDAGGANLAEILQSFLPAAAGDYTVEVFSEAGSGNYSLQMFINAAAEVEQHGGPSNNSHLGAQDLDSVFTPLADGADRAAVLGSSLQFSDDWYSFTLENGQSASLAGTGPSGSQVELYDAGMNLLAAGTSSDNADFLISNLVAPAAGSYFVRIAGSDDPYNLVVVRGSDFDTEPNDGVDPDAQDISQTGHALGHVVDDLEGVTGQSLADHVIHISVDGLRADLLEALVDSNPSEYDAFLQLQDTGAYTYNARTDYTHSITLPNHTAMLTGRPVLAPAGQPDSMAHLWTTNGDPSPSQTLHNNHPSVDYIYSTFDVAHNAGLFTRHYGNKSKFSIYEQSYSDNGAPDTNPEGGDNGTNKIDESFISTTLGGMISPFIDALESTPNGVRSYNFLHFADTDLTGHNSGWGSSAWDSAAANVDDDLAMLLDAIAANPLLAGRTVIVLTADHGGTGGGHGDASDPANYTIPVYAWGPGFDGGADLYDVFSELVVDPGTGRPDFNDPNQPLRNGSTGNLSMALLGLGNVPGSSIFPIESIAPPANLDHYSVDVTAGEAISVKTFTPTGGMSDLANNLDPAIEIYDPTGTLVASAEDGATDGLNVDFSYEAEMTGKYTIVVRADSTPEGDIFGEYFLDVNVGEDEPAVTVEGRHVFYNDSFFDDATFGNDDDTAIDPTKSALLPGQIATKANYISYTRGINGIMVDIANPDGTLDAADFEFHDMGRNGDTPTAAQVPDSITVRPGEGVGGSDRVVMTWDTSGGAIFDTTWLRVTVLESVGLDAADVFYFGSAPGEGSGGEFAQIDPADELGARNNTHGFGNPATVDDPWDYNKDRFVDPVDQLFARNNGTGFTTRLNLMSAPAAGLLSAGPFSAELSSGESDGGPTAAALTGGESGWSTLDSDALGDSSTGGGSSAAADERIWSEEDDEAVLVGSGAYSSDMDGALSEDADWLAWDVL